MTDYIRAALSPLLIISYVFGTRIVEFPAGQPRLWLSLTYIVLSWSVYHILLIYTTYYVEDHSAVYHVCFGLNIFIVLLSIVLAIYYDKKYRNCLKKLAIVDDTLEKLGTATDYQKVHMTILSVACGWIAFVIFLTYSKSFWYRNRYNALKSLYISFLMEYGSFINLIGDLIIASTLGYIELKFDQVNEYLRKLEEVDEFETKRTWEHSMSHPRQVGYPKSSRTKCATWIVIHLHLELRKICREVNSIFELQMTFKMGCYFLFIARNFREIFNAIFNENYVSKTTLFLFFIISTLILYVLRISLINYMCERINIKANATGDLINMISYSSCDVVIRENISQFLLQLTRAPLKFYGLGLFQFGLKFLCGFIGSVVTVIVILVQSHTSIKCCNASN